MFTMKLGAEVTCADDLRITPLNKTGKSASGRHNHIHLMAVKPGLNIGIMVAADRRIRLAFPAILASAAKLDRVTRTRGLVQILSPARINLESDLI